MPHFIVILYDPADFLYMYQKFIVFIKVFDFFLVINFLRIFTSI